MNRLEFRQLATERALDAEALILSHRWSAAYYLAGYAVECALKSCIAKLTVLDDFPDKDAAKVYTHNLEALFGHAKLKERRDTDFAANAAQFENWGVISKWDEGSRYKLHTETLAKRVVAAVNHPTEGVLPWIMVHW